MKDLEHLDRPVKRGEWFRCSAPLGWRDCVVVVHAIGDAVAYRHVGDQAVAVCGLGHFNYYFDEKVER